MSIILSLVALSILIVVHEAGHMVVARWCGMRVEKFSIFFGPVLARFRRGETTYQISAIPLGGYVQIAGMNPQEALPAGDTGSFENKSVWARLATIVAGPATNYLCAVVFCLGLFMIWGMPNPTVTTKVDGVVGGGPADTAGIRPGDRIRRIDGKEVQSPEEVRNAVGASTGRRLAFELERAGDRVPVQVQPRPRQGGGFEIGVKFEIAQAWEPVSTGRAVGAALEWPAQATVAVLGNLWRIVRGREKAEVGGPVEIVRQLKRGFETGMRDALQLLTVLNLMLCIFNLLPIPALDGGRLAFLAYTAVTRRRVNPRVEAAVHTAGFVLLLLLFVLVTYNDIVKLVR